MIKLYNLLLNKYGYQGWWPLINYKGVNITKTGSIKGYHIKDYSFPHNNDELFEICIGAILTQNSSWVNVEKSLINLNNLNLLNVNKLLKSDKNIIKQTIKPSGYFNLKYKYLINFSEFFINLKKTPSREELLKIKGVGNETADNILLYGFKQPEFVVDSYTKRILTNLGLSKKEHKYNDLKSLFENNLKKDYKIFQEFHALLVEHAKHYYLKKPYGKNDFLINKYLQHKS